MEGKDRAREGRQLDSSTHFCGAKFQRPSFRQWRLSSAGPRFTDLLWQWEWMGGAEMRVGGDGTERGGGQDRHGVGGHEGGADGECVLLALDVDRDDLVLGDVLGDGTTCAREALAHALRTREHCRGCVREVEVSRVE